MSPGCRNRRPGLDIGVQAPGRAPAQEDDMSDEQAIRALDRRARPRRCATATRRPSARAYTPDAVVFSLAPPLVQPADGTRDVEQLQAWFDEKGGSVLVAGARPAGHRRRRPRAVHGLESDGRTAGLAAAVHPLVPLDAGAAPRRRRIGRSCTSTPRRRSTWTGRCARRPTCSRWTPRDRPARRRARGGQDPGAGPRPGRRFYRDRLGLEPVEERPGGLRYVVGDSEFHLFMSTGRRRASRPSWASRWAISTPPWRDLRARGLVFESVRPARVGGARRRRHGARQLPEQGHRRARGLLPRQRGQPARGGPSHPLTRVARSRSP